MSKALKIHGIKIDDSIWKKFDEILKNLPSGLDTRIIGGELAPIMIIAVKEHPFFLFPKLTITPEGQPDLQEWQPGEKETFEKICKEANKRVDAQ